MRFFRETIIVITAAVICRVSCFDLDFPDDFILGVGTSNYQTEGAWNVSDKSESSNDYFVHERPDATNDGSNGDIADDSYHKYKEDVQLIKAIGFDAYRLSISWSRLLPNGYANHVSADGLAYYRNFLKELIANGIKTVVTLEHMDHPQNIEDMGGWTNSLIVDLFAAYARVVFHELGSLVDIFVTINEPHIFCEYAYHYSTQFRIAPGKSLGNYGKYLCMHNSLKAHAKAWHIYDDEFRARYNGKIGMVEACGAYHVYNKSNPDNLIAAEWGFQFNCGWSSHPLYVGDYPEIMKTRMAALSEREGYPRSRLPKFTEEEILYIKGSSDFFGLNYYYVMATRLQTAEEAAASPTDNGVVEAFINAQEDVSVGFNELLCRIRDSYGNPSVFVTENGRNNAGGTEDFDRISYFHDLLSSLLKSVKEDDCNVFGYLVWNLIDAWEWSDGYKSKFGLYSVDFESANRTRTPKLSASWWTETVAPGLRCLLRRVRDEYGNPPVLIAENEYCDDGGIEDLERIAYFHDVLTNVLAALKVDGCKVVGYLVWSLIDTWEFSFGYTLKYGLYRVDFESPDRTRTPRWSVIWWKNVMASRWLQPVRAIDTETNTTSTSQKSYASSLSSMPIAFLAISLLSLQIQA